MYNSMSSANRVLLLFFQSGFLLFIFLLWLLWLRLPKLYWVIMARVSTLVLFLIIEEMLCFSTLIMFSVSLSYMAFIMLRYVHPMPTFWRAFIINGCWILSKVFYASIEMIISFLSFSFLISNWLICICWRIYPRLSALGWSPLDHDVWSF